MHIHSFLHPRGKLYQTILLVCSVANCDIELKGESQPTMPSNWGNLPYIEPQLECSPHDHFSHPPVRAQPNIPLSPIFPHPNPGIPAASSLWFSSSKHHHVPNYPEAAPATDSSLCKGISQPSLNFRPQCYSVETATLGFKETIPVPPRSTWRWTSSRHSRVGTAGWLSEG